MQPEESSADQPDTITEETNLETEEEAGQDQPAAAMDTSEEVGRSRSLAICASLGSHRDTDLQGKASEI